MAGENYPGTFAMRAVFPGLIGTPLAGNYPVASFGDGEFDPSASFISTEKRVELIAIEVVAPHTTGGGTLTISDYHGIVPYLGMTWDTTNMKPGDRIDLTGIVITGPPGLWYDPAGEYILIGFST